MVQHGDMINFWKIITWHGGWHGYDTLNEVSVLTSLGIVACDN